MDEQKQRELIYTGKTFNLYNEMVALPNGELIEKSAIRHPGAVVILPVTSDGKLVFVNQYRFVIDEWLLELPAGTMERGEIPLECARREIQEEVGYAASEWTELGYVYSAPGFCDERLYLFLAKGLTLSKLEGDVDEQIEVCLLTVEQVEEAILQNKLNDAKSISAFNRARLNGLI